MSTDVYNGCDFVTKSKYIDEWGVSNEIRGVGMRDFQIVCKKCIFRVGSGNSTVRAICWICLLVDTEWLPGGERKQSRSCDIWERLTEFTTSNCNKYWFVPRDRPIKHCSHWRRRYHWFSSWLYKTELPARYTPVDIQSETAKQLPRDGNYPILVISESHWFARYRSSEVQPSSSVSTVPLNEKNHRLDGKGLCANRFFVQAGRNQLTIFKIS